MRNAGDRTPDGAASRRQRAAGGPQAPSRAEDNGGSALFTPAYRVSHAGGAPTTASKDQSPAGYDPADYPSETSDGAWPEDADQQAAPAWSGDGQEDDPWARASLTRWTTQPEPTPSNAIRGFPPAPGDPMPVYPPGPFAPWNRSPAGGTGAGGWARGMPQSDASGEIAAVITPDDFDTNHSIPAIKDPVLGKTSGSRSSAGSPARSSGRSGSGSASAPVPVRERSPLGEPVRSRKPAGPGDRRPGGSGRSGARPGGKRHQVWLAIVAAVVIIAGGATLLIVTSNPGSPNSTAGGKPGKTPKSTPSTAKPPPGKWGDIGTRGTDAVPLTMHELFPAAFTSSGVVYTRVKTHAATGCKGALIGSALQAAVKQAGCDQQVRGTYVSASQKVMATIGVFNLDNARVANRAAGKVGHNNFVAPLRAKAGPAVKIGQGTGIDEAIIKGHYLVIVWAETTGLQAPKSQRGRLDGFMNLLIARTANVALSYRMVYGKPNTAPTPSV
jgi:hypothetical protein